MAASLLLLELETKFVAPKGDCTIPGFEGHIVLESFSWGISDSTGGRKGTTARVLKAGTARLSKPYDRSSTALCKLMELDPAKSEFHFLRATLKFVDPASNKGTANAKLESIMEVEFTDGFVDEISVRVSEQGKMVSVKEDITLSFQTAVAVRYQVRSPSGRRTALPEFLYVLPKI